MAPYVTYRYALSANTLMYGSVSSMALTSWRSDRQQRLDELLAAHQTVGGTGPGRRWRTRELNWALTLRLAGEFQGFARHLHDLAVDYFVDIVSGGNVQLAEVLEQRTKTNRKLDRGNAQPGSLGSDFALLGLTLWPALEQADPRASDWKTSLERLNTVRNAIAHVDQDALDQLRRDGHPVTLTAVRGWRRDLDRLAENMDDVVSAYLDGLLGQGRPW
jgi:hypothetical protein